MCLPEYGYSTISEYVVIKMHRRERFIDFQRLANGRITCTADFVVIKIQLCEPLIDFQRLANGRSAILRWVADMQLI